MINNKHYASGKTIRYSLRVSKDKVQNNKKSNRNKYVGYIA